MSAPSTSTPTKSPELRPRMRGWLHFYAFLVSTVCASVLITLAAHQGTAAVISCTVYSVTICGLFGVSALYHRRVWGLRGYATMKRLDHSMIFVFIAGTYTPFCTLLLPADKATIMLIGVWLGALCGVALKMVWPRAPKWLSVPLYIGLGWSAVAILPGILEHGGVAALVLLIIGGVLYSLGAISYSIKWPDPWPATFGYHEIFHALTLVAATCHYIAAYFALYA